MPVIKKLITEAEAIKDQIALAKEKLEEGKLNGGKHHLTEARNMRRLLPTVWALFLTRCPETPQQGGLHHEAKSVYPYRP